MPRIFVARARAAAAPPVFSAYRNTRIYPSISRRCNTSTSTTNTITSGRFTPVTGRYCWQTSSFISCKAILPRRQVSTATSSSSFLSSSTQERDIVMLPNHRLLARAFHRLPAASTTATMAARSTTRPLTTSVAARKWEGRKGEEHVVHEGDIHNVQHDNSKKGKRDRAGGSGTQGSRSATESGGKSHEKTKEEFPEAPDTIGMQDERGGKK